MNSLLPFLIRITRITVMRWDYGDYGGNYGDSAFNLPHTSTVTPAKAGAPLPTNSISPSGMPACAGMTN